MSENKPANEAADSSSAGSGDDEVTAHSGTPITVGGDSDSATGTPITVGGDGDSDSASGQ